MIIEEELLLPWHFFASLLLVRIFQHFYVRPMIPTTIYMIRTQRIFFSPIHPEEKPYNNPKPPATPFPTVT